MQNFAIPTPYPHIRIHHGDILKSKCAALVNPVNCLGAAGRGLALQFKLAYPRNHKLYKLICQKRELKPGLVAVYQTDGGKYIINFPTKLHWSNPSKLSYISDGLISLIGALQSRSIPSVAVPALGCGLGGLEWFLVQAIITEAFAPCTDIQVDLYPPNDYQAYLISRR